MKLLTAAIFVFITTAYSFAQSGFQECGDLKKKAMQNFMEMTMKKDTAGARQALFHMNADWYNCLIGKSIKDLSLKTFSGQVLDENDFKGKIIVINFWYANCTPCLAEMPALNKLVKAFQDSSVMFLGITYNNESEIESILQRIKFDFLVIPDSRDVVDKFGVSGYPTTMIVDKNLTIRKLWLGGGTNENISTEAYNRAKPIIDSLLKEE